MAETADHDSKLESTKLLTIFPEEVWLQILETIFHPKDLQHLQETSKFFEKLLRSIKTRVLFPAVVKIIFAKCHLTPSEMQSLLLNSRLVSRTWELGVNSVLDSIFNYHSLIDSVRFAEDCGSAIPFTNISTKLAVSAGPQQFLEHFDDSYAIKSRNPFICRSVEIPCGNLHFNDESATLKHLQIFQNYGHNVSHFSVSLGTYSVATFQFATSSNIWWYERLRDMIKLMPNLIVLSVSCHAWEFDDDFENLKLIMQSFKFSTLEKLRHLHIQQAPKPVFIALLRSYSYVSMLSVRSFRGVRRTSDKALYAHPMPNLTELSFALESNKQLAHLEASNPRWPLKLLFLEIGTLTMDWQKLFGVLENRWASTLTELKIDIRSFQYDCSIQVLPSLKLPNLKVFLFFTKNLVPLDFILEVKNSLERLIVKYSYNAQQLQQPESQFESEKVIKFYKFRRNIMESNIWHLFPKLNRVVYSDTEISKMSYQRILPRRVTK